MKVLLIAGLLFGFRGAEFRPPILDTDYPRACFFRKAETAITQVMGASYEEWEPAFNRLSGIIGKALGEEIPKAAITNSFYFNRFKEKHPEQLVLLHYDGTARDPFCGTTLADFSAGHWIYYAAADILGDVPNQTGNTVISVSSTNHFELNIGRYADRTDYPTLNSDIVLYSLKPDGTPDWEHSEQVKLLGVDGINNMITVERGCYGTSPKAFVGGSARAAAHQVDGPWSYDTGLLWTYNFSTACPKNSDGKNCADVLAEDLASHFLSGGKLEGFDGVEFDVARNYDAGWSSGDLSDMDNDGVNEGGLVGGVNTYGTGVIEFYEKLRRLLGQNCLILADGGTYLSQRAAGVINGIETEGFPTIASDTNAATWSSGLNFQNFWAQNAASPRLNYINYRQIFPSFSYNRLVFAASQCIDAVAAWSILPDPEASDPFGIGIWDEFKKGQDNQTGWLGQPLGPAVHPVMQTPDLLAGEFETNSVVSNGYRFVMQPIVCPSNDLVVVVRSSCEALTGHPASYARLLRVYIEPTPLLRPLLGATPHFVPMSWVNHTEFESVFCFRNITDPNVSLTLEFEGTNNVTIHSIKAYGGPDVMFRVFERGVVVANPSLQPYTFNLQDMSPGCVYRRLQASSRQDLLVNDGTEVDSHVTIDPLDGLFLIRSDIEQVLMSDSFAGLDLDSDWTLQANATALVSNGVVRLVPPGVLTSQRAFISRNTGVDHSSTNSAGEQVFNFYDHPLTVHADLGMLSGTPDVGKRISYFMGICDDAIASDRAPQWADSGVFFEIEKLNVAGAISFRLAVQECFSGSSETAVLRNLSGAPEQVEIFFNGNAWTIALKGAVSSDGSSTASGALGSVQESDFTDFYFSTGLVHEGPALEKGVMEIDHIDVTTVPPL